MTEMTGDLLRTAGLDVDEMQALVRGALAEDLRYGSDATTEATVGLDAVAEARFSTRMNGVLAGVGIVRLVLDEVLGTDGYDVLSANADGDRLTAGDCVLHVRARTAGLLTAERTALNLLCHLSGIATETSKWVDAVSGTGCRIRDSRKTLPGLRSSQKYAVRCGGGLNHRLGLGDAILIKDNHVVAAGSVTEALHACRSFRPDLPLEVEVSTLDELEEVLRAGDVRTVLLDNFTSHACAQAVRRTKELSPLSELEASGGLTLDVAREYAATGVHYLAVGGLTHSVRALDIGLDL